MAAITIKTTSKVTPKCYAYTTPGVPAHDGWTKIGFTERDVETRIKEQTHTVGIAHKTHWALLAKYITDPCVPFTDKDFHAYLKKLEIPRETGTEWFFIEPDKARSDFKDFMENHGILPGNDAPEVIPYTLREEQKNAVEKTVEYFSKHQGGKFLWNAKPRFGKTLAVYDFCKRINAEKVVIVTNRPAIANSWYDDYVKFLGPRSGYRFVSENGALKNAKYCLHSWQEYVDTLAETFDVIKPIYFVSLQDLKGSDYLGGHYDKLAELSDDSEHGLDWDVLIVDEAHEGVDTYKTDIAFDHIKRRFTLHLSGTPFKALANDKFPESAIYNWTYADEQKRKRDWNSSNELENPYENLPRLSLFTYQMSDIVRDRVKRGIELADGNTQEYAFDLNEFFATNESGKFVHDSDVDKFLDALTRQEKFPFSTSELRNELKHTFWILNRVASAKALAKKLRLHPVFKDYEIVLAAGDGKLNDDDETAKSFDKVVKAIAEHDKTITLSVGQLTTGVTIPEWTAVLMLSNMASPSLYMQAAFRAQNPCLFTVGDESYRKQNAYVFDFDPARTLTIFEKFANDLIPETSGDKGDFDSHKRNVRELLNFFPVYSEDDEGSMIELDAEKVLTIPRHIHAREVVERGFMSNFLFANISGIFSAPREIIDAINNMQAIEEPKALAPAQVDEDTADNLCLNEDGEVEIPREQVIGTANDIFGEKIYGEIWEQIEAAVEEYQKEMESKPDPERDELKELSKIFSKPIADTFIGNARIKYGSDLRKSTQNRMERQIRENTESVLRTEYGNYKINDNNLARERDKRIKEAQQANASMEEITQISEEYDTRHNQCHREMVDNIHKNLQSKETIDKNKETIAITIETEKKNAEKDSIEGGIRDHLRGFSRTIPAFLMAYGDENTTLANFDTLVPEEVFWEVTVNPQNGVGVTLDLFRMLRDGGDYVDENGEEKHFDGHFFDEVVFNDAIREFLKKRAELANYFETDHKGDIFDYIPPQRTNQIFTPKKVVQDMVDRLEEENPGCFDDPDATFADLYMKSGMYITEIVTRLYQSKRMKALYPDDAERLNHIFEKQVYGCAPTEIIYRICRRYILGFSDEIHIEKDNIRLCDTLEFAKNGTMDAEMRKLFDL